MLRFLDKVQDEKGNSIEYWRDRGWVHGIGNFIAGEGYIVQANKNGILIIDETISEKSGVLFAERMETTHFKISYGGNEIEHMNINISQLNKFIIHAGDEIAAFDGDTCVGAIKLN